MLDNISEQFNNLLFNLMDKGFGSMFGWGIFFIVLGVIILIVSFYIISKSKTKSNVLLDNAIAQDNLDVQYDILVNGDVPKVVIDEDVITYDINDYVTIAHEGEIPKIVVESNLVNEISYDDINVTTIIDGVSDFNGLTKEEGDIKKVSLEENDNSVAVTEEVVASMDGEIPDVAINAGANVREEIDDIKASVIYEPVTEKYNVSDDFIDELTDIDEIELVESNEIINEEKIEDEKTDEFVEIADDENNSSDLIKEIGNYDKENFEEIEDAPEIVVNNDLDVIYPGEVDIKISHPVKGKEINVDLSSLEEEEEIELL